MSPFSIFFAISWKNHQGHAIEMTFKSLWWSLPCLVAVCIAPQYSDWNIRLRSDTWPWFRLPSILSGMQCSSYYYYIFLLWWYIREYETRKCLASAERESNLAAAISLAGLSSTINHSIPTNVGAITQAVTERILIKPGRLFGPFSEFKHQI